MEAAGVVSDTHGSRACRKTGESTYVSDIDCLAPLRASGREVGEGVGRDRGGSTGVEAAASTTWATASTNRAAESTSSTTVSSAEAATTSREAATATEASSKATAAATEAATAAEAHACVGEPVGADLEDATLPIIAVELLDGVASVVGGLEDNDTGALGPSVGTKVHIGADDTTGAG